MRGDSAWTPQAELATGDRAAPGRTDGARGRSGTAALAAGAARPPTALPRGGHARPGRPRLAAPRPRRAHPRSTAADPDAWSAVVAGLRVRVARRGRVTEIGGTPDEPIWPPGGYRQAYALLRRAEARLSGRRPRRWPRISPRRTLRPCGWRPRHWRAAVRRPPAGAGHGAARVAAERTARPRNRAPDVRPDRGPARAAHPARAVGARPWSPTAAPTVRSAPSCTSARRRSACTCRG